MAVDKKELKAIRAELDELKSRLSVALGESEEESEDDDDSDKPKRKTGGDGKDSMSAIFALVGKKKKKSDEKD